MILKSIRDDSEYFWIKIPRTATHSFKEVFSKYNKLDEDKHYHRSYVELCSIYDKKLEGVTLVRNPVTRFKSILNYISNRNYYSVTGVSQLLKSTDSCVNFLNSNFFRNCIPKAPSVSDLFIDLQSQEYVSNHEAFFRTQTYYAYHPNVKIFFYEQMEDFVYWVKKSLGYDLNKLPIINNTNRNVTNNIDFTDPDLIRTIENLYYIDYKVFDYPLQYLT